MANYFLQSKKGKKHRPTIGSAKKVATTILHTTHTHSNSNVVEKNVMLWNAKRINLHHLNIVKRRNLLRTIKHLLKWQVHHWPLHTCEKSCPRFKVQKWWTPETKSAIPFLTSYFSILTLNKRKLGNLCQKHKFLFRKL